MTDENIANELNEIIDTISRYAAKTNTTIDFSTYGQFVYAPGASGIYYNNGWIFYDIDDRLTVKFYGPFSRENIIRVMAIRNYLKCEYEEIITSEIKDKYMCPPAFSEEELFSRK